MNAKIKEFKNLLGTIGKRTGYYGIRWHKENNGLLISELTGKLEGLHSVSTSPETSDFCAKMANCKGSICEDCFSRKSVIPELGGYKGGLRKNLIHNSVWLAQEHEIEDFPQLNDLYCRIESHGDVDAPIQAINFIKLVLRNHETHFTAWTKNVIAWNEAIKVMGKPKNLIMIYSSPMKNMEVKLEAIQKVFPWIDKVFTVYTYEYMIDHKEIIPTINCGAKQCLACKLCYTENNVKQIREAIK